MKPMRRIFNVDTKLGDIRIKTYHIADTPASDADASLRVEAGLCYCSIVTGSSTCNIEFLGMVISMSI